MAESKLAEKTVEIDKIMEENRAMKESMDRINNHQILKPEASKLGFFSKIIGLVEKFYKIGIRFY